MVYHRGFVSPLSLLFWLLLRYEVALIGQRLFPAIVEVTGCFLSHLEALLALVTHFLPDHAPVALEGGLTLLVS